MTSAHFGQCKLPQSLQQVPLFTACRHCLHISSGIFDGRVEEEEVGVLFVRIIRTLHYRCRFCQALQRRASASRSESSGSAFSLPNRRLVLQKRRLVFRIGASSFESAPRLSSRRLVFQIGASSFKSAPRLSNRCLVFRIGASSLESPPCLYNRRLVFQIGVSFFESAPRLPKRRSSSESALVFRIGACLPNRRPSS